MTREEFQEFHKWMTDNGRDLCRKKSEDYAKEDDVMQNFKLCEIMGICSVETGFLVRLCDKFQRLVNVIRDGNSVEDETEFDTLLDEVNYRILLAAWRKERTAKEKVQQLELPGEWASFDEVDEEEEQKVSPYRSITQSIDAQAGVTERTPPSPLTPAEQMVYSTPVTTPSAPAEKYCSVDSFETHFEEAQRIAKEIAES